MPIIWNKQTNTVVIENGFSSQMLIVEPNRKIKIASITAATRGSIIDYLIITEDLWERFRQTEMWACLAPCLRPDGLIIRGKKHNNRGLTFYETIKEMDI